MRIKTFISVFALALALLGCSSKDKEPQPINAGDQVRSTKDVVKGGLYYSPGEDGKYKVSKVLVIDEFSFHVRMYANKFDVPPLNVDSTQLTVGEIESPEGLGIGHASIAKEDYLTGGIVFIRQEAVAGIQKEILQSAAHIRSGDITPGGLHPEGAWLPYHVWRLIKIGPPAGQEMVNLLDDNTPLPLYCYRGRAINFTGSYTMVREEDKYQVTVGDVADFILSRIYQVDSGYRSYDSEDERQAAKKRWLLKSREARGSY